jgi:hypothetical protein
VVYVPYYQPLHIYSSWWWPDYPPWYWPAPRGYHSGISFYWGTGIHFSTAFLFSTFHWHDRHIVVVNHHYPAVYGRHAAPTYATHRWHHNPDHRHGVHDRYAPPREQRSAAQRPLGQSSPSRFTDGEPRRQSPRHTGTDAGERTHERRSLTPTAPREATPSSDNGRHEIGNRAIENRDSGRQFRTHTEAAHRTERPAITTTSPASRRTTVDPRPRDVWRKSPESHGAPSRNTAPKNSFQQPAATSSPENSAVTSERRDYPRFGGNREASPRDFAPRNEQRGRGRRE